MSTELCTEDAVLQLATPQVSSDATCIMNTLASRAQNATAGMELGRKLLLAARAGDTPTVLELMAKGAPFTTDWLGTSPLHLAAANNHVETCSVLLRAGVSRDARTKVERTPLHLAAHSGHADVISLLLGHGASPDCRDMLQMTPLHWASARGHEAAARVLLRGGASPLVRCKFHKRPRDLALRHHHSALISLLQEAELQTATEHLIQKEEKEGQHEPMESVIEVEPTKKLLDNVIRIEAKKVKPKSVTNDATTTSNEAAQLLKRHGITLLPADNGSTVLTALQSGRTVALSDAGKLMLQESSNTIRHTGHNPGMVIRGRPRCGAGAVKVLTLNNKLVALGERERYQPVKFVQLSADGKIPSAGLSSIETKATAGVKRPPVKIVINRGNFNKLVAVSGKSATKIDGMKATATTTIPTINVKEERATEPESSCGENCLARRELAVAVATINSLRNQLAAANQRIASLQNT
ncbi:unnamed protein product [Leptosia nina]|uniref:Uncharacterized protein n=1 Tax=Leptosia nina TaxID=320188 RepID=A0AAV1J056_9NEOP